jgi:carbon storage regulator
MLVLSRQKNEAIMIGDDIEITVVDIRGDRVRLGIAAPHDIPVHRKEVYESIRRENIEASRSQVKDLSQLDALLGGPAKEEKKPEEGDQEKK